MAQPTTRKEFKEWCLRKLGKPVIEINVDEDQVDDRVDESISYWNDYHFDGTEKTFFKKELTQQDIDNQYITVPENIIGVINIFDIGDSLSTNNLFNIRYQFALNEIYDLSNYNLSNYYMAMQHIQFLEEILVGKQPIRYNRHVNKLHIDMDWEKVNVGHFIVAEAYQVLDPNTYQDMWKDRWLQNYATAKIQETWGRNLTKFEGMQLPGGVTFNGMQILQDAKDEIQKLEEEMIVSYSLPVTDLIG
jgi:hypothetical protein